MGKTIKTDGFPAGCSDGNRVGVRKSGSILERRSYDKSKTKTQLTSTLQDESSNQLVVPVEKTKRNRSRRASMSDFSISDPEPGTIGIATQPCSSIPLRNSFEILSHLADDAEIDGMDDSPSIANKSSRCPPITVCKMSVQEINKMLHELNGDGKFVLRNLKGAIQIRSKCRTLFARVQEALKRCKAEFFTHSTREEVSVKIVLSGLPYFGTEEVKTELAKNNISPHEVKLLSKSSDNDEATYVLHFAKGTVKLNKLREVKYLFNVVVWWRHWARRTIDVLQCFRCQRFGHGSRHCNMQIRCVKCGKHHASSECAVPKKTIDSSETHKDVKCVNCGQNHVASFKECPHRLSFIKRQGRSAPRPSPNGNPPTSTPRKFISNRVISNQSFAEVVAGPPTSSVRPESNYNATGRSDTDLFTLSEFLGLARDMFNRFKACNTREEQFFALHELMAKYLYIH